MVVVLRGHVLDPNLHQPSEGAAAWVLETTGFSPNGGDDPIFIPDTSPVVGTSNLVPDLLIGIPPNP